MKKIIFSLSFLTIYISLFAQFGYADYNTVEKLKNTKTYVPLAKDNEKFNASIKDAVEKYWTFTPYEFIPFEELEKYIKSENNSFLIVNDFVATTSTGDIDVGTSFYDGKPLSLRVPLSRSYSVYGTSALTFQLGGKMVGRLRNWHAFCYAGINGVGLQSTKIYNYIQLIQQTLAVIEKNKMKEIRASEAKKIYAENITLKDKKIIFWEGDIPTLKARVMGFKEDKTYLSKRANAETLKKPFDIVKEEELLEKIIENDPANLFFGTYVEGSFNVIFLFDGTGKVHFYEAMPRIIRPENTQWWKMVLKKLDEQN